MFVALLTAATVGAVPKVAAGPDLKDRATLVEAPIDRVEVFSDRARVTRAGRFDAKGGVLALRLPDLPGATLLDSLRAEAEGAAVLRVEAIPVERERVSIDQVEDLLVRLETETDALARLDAQISSKQEALSVVSGLSPAAPVDEDERRAPVRWSPDLWRRVLDVLADVRAKLQTEKLALEAKRREARRALEATQREVQGMNLGAFTDQKVQVVLLLEVKGGRGRVELSYDVPGAFWKPAYDLYYDAKGGTADLATYGVVQQATGEDWEDVELILSTAIPGIDIAVPELLTWTLGEAKEMIPRPRAATRPPSPPRYPAPQPTADAEQLERQSKMSLLQHRLQELTALASLDMKDTVFKGAGQRIGPQVTFGRGVGDLSARSKAKKRPSRRRARPAPSRAPPAPAPAAPEMDDMPMSLSSVEAERVSPSGASIGSASASERVRRTSLALFEPDYRRRGPSFSDRDLPAVSANGREYSYRARTRMDVPSSNQSLRAPLGRATYPVSAFYEAAPALAKNAYLKASVQNPGPQAILRGPVTIFVNGSFVGDGRLETTPEGGDLELPFGADEDIELVYQVVPSTETQGVFGKDEVTTYRVIMELANYKKRPVSVVVREPVPRSRKEEIEVELVKTTVEPDDIDTGNIYQWTVTIAPGRKQTVELIYRIRRPEGWQLQQQ